MGRDEISNFGFRISDFTTKTLGLTNAGVAPGFQIRNPQFEIRNLVAGGGAES